MRDLVIHKLSIIRSMSVSPISITFLNSFVLLL